MSENRSHGGGGGMGGMGRNMAPAGKPKDTGNTLRKLGAYLAPYKLSVLLVIFFALLSTTFSIIGPKLLGKVTSKLVEGLLAYYYGTGLLTDFTYIRNFIILLLVLYVISSICQYIQSFIMSGVSMKITFNLRKDLSEKMNRIPLSYYDSKTHGEILSRVTNDVDMVNQTLNQSLTQIITSVVTIVGVIIMMFSISWLMTVVALLVIPLSMVIVGVIIKKSQHFFKTQMSTIGQINGHVEEMYGGHTVVQSFNGEEDSLEKFEVLNEQLYGVAWKSQFVSGMMMPIMTFVGNLGYVIVSILGGYLAVKKVVEIGDIQAFIQYMRNFTQPMGQLASVSSTLQSTIAAAERVFEFLAIDEETIEQTEPMDTLAFQGAVEFQNVHFGYTKEKTIINDFSVRINPGQKVAIVGPTGAGKTTIVKLLMRFYDIDSGKIFIDGRDTYAFSRNDLRSLFGMVLQETWLYNASILDNIRYGNFDATEEEVIEAAKAAHCHEFIQSLPDGYHMILNEEASNISQGQKQLFTIARVILANPKILILDEATSSVDTRTEILIQRAMDHLMSNRTSFVIAHRLSTIKDADLILVMKDGDIIETGNHVELLAQNGFYADLYNSQFSDGDGGFEEYENE